jgi:hypothetical protein
MATACHRRRPIAFEEVCSVFTGSRASEVSNWRRGAESNRRIKVLQTSPLPLGYRARFPQLLYYDYWSGKRDSNPRLRPWQGRTLPLSYSRSSPFDLRPDYKNPLCHLSSRRAPRQAVTCCGPRGLPHQTPFDTCIFKTRFVFPTPSFGVRQSQTSRCQA